MAQQFWVRINGRTQGPFSSGQLKKFAAQGKLKPQHEVSTDRQRWAPVSAVKGLSAPAPAAPADDMFQDVWESPPRADEWPVGDAAPLASSDLWDELPDGATAAAAPATATPGGNPASPSLPAGYGAAGPAADSVAPAPGSTESMAFSWPAGVGIGVSIGVVLLVCGCTLTAIVAAAAGESALGVALVLAVGFGGLIAAGAVFACSGYGSSTTIALTANGPGRATCTVTRRLAFLPVHSEEFLVTSSDTLYKQIQEGGTFLLVPTTADIFMLLFILLMCAIGLIPGLIFWAMWWNSRNDAQHCYCDVALTIKAQNRGNFLRLWKQRVREYRATRFGDPTELEKLMKMFARYAGPKLVVQEL